MTANIDIFLNYPSERLLKRQLFALHIQLALEVEINFVKSTNNTKRLARIGSPSPIDNRYLLKSQGYPKLRCQLSLSFIKLWPFVFVIYTTSRAASLKERNAKKHSRSGARMISIETTENAVLSKKSRNAKAQAGEINKAGNVSVDILLDR